MASVFWLGVDGDLANVANYSTGALPTNGSDFWITQGNIDITTNLTALSGKTLKSWNVTTGFKGSIGTNGTSAVINVNDGSATDVRIAQAGAYIYWSGTFTGTGSITVGSTGSGVFYMTGGSFASKTFVGGLTGKVVIGSGVTAEIVYSAGIGFDISAAFITGLFKGGNHILRADCTTLSLGANVGCTLEGSGVDINTANLESGSRLILNNGGAVAGVITTANAYPGSLIQNGGKFDNTITNLYAWAGSTQVPRAAASVTTITNNNPVGSK